MPRLERGRLLESVLSSLYAALNPASGWRYVPYLAHCSQMAIAGPPLPNTICVTREKRTPAIYIDFTLAVCKRRTRFT
jgi:hypothetical protein